MKRSKSSTSDRPNDDCSTSTSCLEWFVYLPPLNEKCDSGWTLYASLPGKPAFGRSYRTALAMKGGVSLAVWIGGAVAELDIVRRIRIRRDGDKVQAFLLFAVGQDGDHTPMVTEVAAKSAYLFERARYYAAALVARKYDEIGFDVLAGASAGGLTAVLYGVAQRAGAAVDSMLDTWVEYGSLWNLLAESGDRKTDSALRGDRYFWPSVTSALRRLNSDPSVPRHRHAVSKQVVVELSATILDPDPSDARGTKEGQGDLRFVGSSVDPAAEVRRRIPPASPLPRSDLNSEDAKALSDELAAIERDLRRLAYAARTTSSFPGAFEPALIYSGAADSAGEVEPIDSQTVDMSFAFGAQRADSTIPYRTSDGGVTDNIPVERALRSLRNFLESEQYSDRAIIYLDPSPASEHGRWWVPLRYWPAPQWGSQRRRTDPQSAFLHAVAVAIEQRGIRESGEQEREDVETYRRLLYLAQGRNESFAVLAGANLSNPRPDWFSDEASAAYVRFRSTADLDHLTRVLMNPSLWQLMSDLPFRRRRVPQSDDVLRALEHELINRYDTISREPNCPSFVTVLRGSQGRLDAAWCAISWLRTLDRIATSSTPGLSPQPVPDWAALRRNTYALLSAAVRSRDKQFDRLLQAAQSEVTVRDKVDAIMNAWLPTEQPDEPILQPEWWANLSCILVQLRNATIWLRSPGVGGSELEQCPWAGIPTRDESFVAADLAPFASTTGIPEPMRGLRFWTITAAEFDGLDGFPRIKEGRDLLVARSAARLPDAEATISQYTGETAWTEHENIADAKLAGSSIANFGGFLNKRWRRNDWWWGRIDACAGILRVLAPPSGSGNETVAGTSPSLGLNGAINWLLRDMNASPDRPYSDRAEDKPEVIAMSMSAGAESLSDLPATYRFALASRLVRAVDRAVVARRPIRATFSVLLRPLLLALPLVVDLPRGLLVATTLTALSILLSGPSNDGASAQLADSLPVLAACAVISAAPFVIGVGLALSRHRWWSRRKQYWPLTKGAAIRGRRRAVAAEWATVGAALALASFTLVLFVNGAGSAGLVASVLLSVLVVVAGWVAGRQLFGRASRSRIGIYCAVAFICAGLLLSAAFAPPLLLPTAAPIWNEPGRLEATCITGMALLALGLILTAGWLWGFRRKRGRHTIVVLILLLALAAAGAAAAVGVTSVLIDHVNFGPGWAAFVGVVVCAYLWSAGMWLIGERPGLQRVPPAEEHRQRPSANVPLEPAWPSVTLTD